MDLKLFFSVFCTIFLSELGDKTQLAVLGFAAGSSNLWSVFWGGALALVFSTLLSTILGKSLGLVFPLKYMRMAGALLFIGFGFWMLFVEE